MSCHNFWITVANADLAMARGETDTALNILRTVGPEQPYYIQVLVLLKSLIRMVPRSPVFSTGV